MDLFELKATLGLDTNPYKAGLQAAAKLAADFAKTVYNFGKDVVETGMEFDKSIGKVYAVSGAYDDYSKSLLRTSALQEASNSIFTASEVAMAEYYEGLAGFEPEEIAAGLHGIVVAAEAADEPLKDVSNILTDTVRAFGEGPGQITRYADVFAAAATSSNTTMLQMGQAMQYVGPVAGSLSYSLEVVATSMGLIADAGIKGSKAGTALRNIMNRLSTNTGAQIDLLTGEVIEPGALDLIEDMGVEFFDAYGKARPWNEFLTDMRAAWNQLDPSKAEQVAAAFTDMDISAEDADSFMEDFASGLQDWRAEWNKLYTDTERQDFADRLAPQFEALGISMYDSQGKLRAFGDVAHEAEIRLGALSDQERQYIGKKIGSLRGISAWLRLMSATDEEYQELYESIMNADGAADKMRETMYDNLYGDVVHFNAALDTLKTAIYYDIDSPLRKVAQMGTDALKRIEDAVYEDGLEGGIKQLSQEIKDMTAYLKPMIQELGVALQPIFDTIIESLIPSVLKAGAALGEGIIDGILAGMSTSDNPIIKFLGNALSEAGFSLYLPNNPTFQKLDPDMYAASIESAVEEVDPHTIPLTLDPEVELPSKEELASMMGDVPVEADTSSIPGDITSAVDSVGTLTVAVQGVWQGISGLFYGGGGGSLIQGGGGHFAKATYGGRILHGATVFGMDSNGMPLVGGESSPEAVVGVGSLHQMINDSVSGAFSGMLDRLDGMIDRMPGGNMRVVLDTGALVGGLVGEMDMSLNERAVWKGYGRTL